MEYNPNYRFIYQWETPSLTRTVCYKYGRSTMSTVREFAQWGCDYLNCPLSFGTGVLNDYFNTWTYMLYERCTSCEYKSSRWKRIQIIELILHSVAMTITQELD